MKLLQSIVQFHGADPVDVELVSIDLVGHHAAGDTGLRLLGAGPLV